MNLAAVLAQARSWEGSCFLGAFALALVLRFVLPAEARRRLRGTLALLGIYLVLSLAGLAVGGAHGKGAHTLHLLAVFFLTLAVVHVFFVLIFDGVARGRVPRILQDVLLAVAFFVGVMALFSAGGVELSSILTTSALLTAVLGFALQDTLGNVIGGLAIQLKRPFAVGDWVSLDGNPERCGRVTEINWRDTRVLTNEQVQVIIPNSNIAKGTVVNFSLPGRPVRRSLHVSVGYDVPPSRVEEVAVRAMRGSPGVLADPPPECIVAAFGSSGIEYWCRFFIDDFERRDAIAGGVGARLYYDFRRESITIPYPIRTVHLHERSDEQAQRESHRRIEHLAQRFQAIDFLAPLGPDVLRDLAARVRTAVYGRGEAIVRQGQNGTDLFVLDRGEVSVQADGGGSAREIARLGAGDFFGEMSLMTGEARRATVVALGDVEAVCVDKDSFREVLARDPRVAEEISRVLAERQTALDAKLAAGAADSRETVESRSRALVKRMRSFFRI